MYSGKLLWATGVNHLKRKKRKKSSDDTATDGDPGAFILRDNATWTDNVEDDKQRKTGVGNWRQSYDEKKQKKIA